MIISRIVLENYGLFAGRSEFDLAPRTVAGKKRPIVLVGGKNGAGKTTFLDAIRLALYGRQAVGARLSDREYQETLASRIHRQKGANTGPRFAKVAIEFEIVTSGERNRFYIERSWLRRQQGVDEYFRVEKDGAPVDELTSDHWATFIADVIPERLSQLFFFDGEKIKLIAEDITGNDAICRAIHNLLGIDIVERLAADLSIFTTRIAKAGSPAEFDVRMESVEAEIASLDKQIAELAELLPSLRTERQGLQNELARIEATLREQGAAFADDRQGDAAAAERLTLAVADAQRRIRDGCNSAAPFTLCPTVASHLLKGLRAESLASKQAALRREIDTLRNSIRQALTDKAAAGTLADAAQVNSVVEECCNVVLTRLGSGDFQKLYALSDSKIAEIESTVGPQAQASGKELLAAIADLENQSRLLQTVQRKLRETPDDDVLKPTLTALTELNQTIGGLNERMSRSEEGLNTLQRQRDGLERQRTRIAQEIAATSAASEKLLTIKKVLPALKVYRDRLTQLKIDSLQTAVTQCFNRLARKHDFIRSISIDPTSFAVHVRDKYGQTIPKEDLSSGEKQMFAIAVLWGLAQTSGRALPLVVDTPLGRLDSDHRKNLIDHYFPNASQQVILLSTDTEVDESLFEQLAPSISHCFHLRYDADSDATIAEEEYFWRTKQVA